MKEKKKSLVMIAVGGSGGHLYPAQALAVDLIKQRPDLDIMFIGHGLNKNLFFDKTLFRFEDVISSTLSLKSWWKIPAQLICLLKGSMKSLAMIKKSEPDVVVGFGSYHSLPPLLAAHLKAIPYILFESNSILGKVNKFFSSTAHMNAYQLFSISQGKKKNFCKTNMPLIEQKLQKVEPREARAFFELDPSLCTLLMFGGSQGAHSLNLLFLEAISLLKKQGKDFQVIHLVGFNTPVESLEKLYLIEGIKVCLKVFEPSMHYAYSAADVVVSRSGSNTISELLHHELPALFVPYPFLSDRHQYHNAKYICEDLKGGILLEQKGLTPEMLSEHLGQLMEKKEEIKNNLKRSNHKETKLSLTEVVLNALARDKQ